MKRLLVSAAILSLVTGAALAQTATPPAPPPAGLAGQPQPGMAGQPQPGALAGQPRPGLAGQPGLPGADAPRPPVGEAGMQPPPPPPPGMADDDDAGAPPPPPPGGRGRRPPPPPMSRAAHFHLQRGDLLLDVKCADDEATKACADTVMQMLDRVQTATAPAPGADTPAVKP